MKISLSTTISNSSDQFKIFVPAGLDLSDIYEAVKQCFQGDIKTLVATDIFFIYCSILIKIKNLKAFLYTQEQELDPKLEFKEPHWVRCPTDLIKDQKYVFDDQYVSFKDMSNEQKLGLYYYLEPRYHDEFVMIYGGKPITGLNTILTILKDKFNEL